MENIDSLDGNQPNSSEKRQNKENKIPESWVKTLNSPDFIIDSSSQDNSGTKKTAVKPTKLVKNSATNQNTKTPVKNAKNKVVNSNLTKTLSGNSPSFDCLHMTQLLEHFQMNFL
jgi:hypothetical protein